MCLGPKVGTWESLSAPSMHKPMYLHEHFGYKELQGVRRIAASRTGRLALIVVSTIRRTPI